MESKKGKFSMESKKGKFLFTKITRYETPKNKVNQNV